VRVNRESHADLTFETCASAGCHNFHDNRALYEDFLVKHGNDPWLLENAIHEAAAMVRGQPEAEQAEIDTYIASVVAAPDALDTDITNDWAHSAHAQADVGCGGCHAVGYEAEEEIQAHWTEKPGEAVCAECHRSEASTFALGRHGMRRHPEIANPRQPSDILEAIGIDEPSERMVTLLDTYLADPETPAMMSTAEARVAIRPEAHGAELSCSTCHAPHDQNISYAAVDGCLSCHNALARRAGRRVATRQWRDMCNLPHAPSRQRRRSAYQPQPERHPSPEREDDPCDLHVLSWTWVCN